MRLLFFLRSSGYKHSFFISSPISVLPLLLEIKRAASVCTFSILLIWFLLDGSQAALAYSKCARQRAL